MKIEQFLHHYISNAPQLMWLLGAGASRSSGMPSATDIIWDLKRLYYCTKENRTITDNELSNEAIKEKIQNYLVGEGAPALLSEDEYSYYFKLVLGNDLKTHQNYLQEKLNPKIVSVNSGYRILSALMEMELTRIVFTTNFDNVLETAYAQITGKDLHAFNLEGSSAVLNALNSEMFPIYAKMHGDFRYNEMKNLPEHLLKNDREIETCFINACSRYGLVVSGYSGRDKNVMGALNEALEQRNAFPKGLFWITSINGFAFNAVEKLINKANAKGINAHIIPSDTFDTLLGRIWKLIQNKPEQFDRKIRRSIYEIPKIQKYSGQGGYPVVRMNAFPILELPQKCKSITLQNSLDYTQFREKIKAVNSAAIFSKGKTIMAWGSDEEIKKVFPDNEIDNLKEYDLNNYYTEYGSSTHFNSFLNWALSRALVRDKPLVLRKKHGKFYAVIGSRKDGFPEIEKLLKEALKSYDYKTKKEIIPKTLADKINNVDAFWMEAAELSLDYYDGKFWLVIKPDIWIEPDNKRKESKDFLTAKKRNRYNITQNRLLEVWKKILIGDADVILKTYPDGTSNNAEFKISVITAFSQRQNNG